jgi:uncharacterized Zn-finger protein
MLTNNYTPRGNIDCAAPLRINGANAVWAGNEPAGAGRQFEHRIGRAIWARMSHALENMLRRSPVRLGELERALDQWQGQGGGFSFDQPAAGDHPSEAGRAGLPCYRNDAGARAITIGASSFHCIGVSPPDDHPHIFLQMEAGQDIQCPYCSTRYIFDGSLCPDESAPAGCLYEMVSPEKQSLAGGTGS